MNSVALAGRLATEPELRYSTDGMPIAKFRIAITRPVAKGPDGKTPADFIPVTAFRKTAEIVAQYSHKGDLVSVLGSINTNQYQDKDGTTRYGWSVIANRVGFLAKKGANGNGNGQAAASEAAPAEDAMGDESMPPADPMPEAVDVPF